jgi:hypothetical protein
MPITINRSSIAINRAKINVNDLTNWIWPENFVPSTTPFSDGTAQFLNVGVRVYSTSAGYITSIRYYKEPNNTLAITGSLWTSGGTLLASVPFASTPSSVDGWVSQDFTTPIQIQANTVYEGSITIQAVGGNLRYYATNNFFDTSSTTNGTLVAVRDNVGFGRNGIYVYSTTPGAEYPTDTNNQGPNYWVDVKFSLTPR